MKKLKRRFITVMIAIGVIAAIVGALLALAAIEKANAVKVNVDSSAFRPGIAQAIVKASAYKFVVVTFSVTNRTGKPLAIDPLKQSYVTDNNDARYAPSPVNLKNEFKATQVADNETQSGQMSYAVPNNVTKLSLHLDLNTEYNFKVDLSPTS